MVEQTRSLFKLPIHEITYEDIRLFVEQKIPEGRMLDYKKCLPKNISKTIAAMGNTDGGIILLGVEEEKEQEEGRRSFPGKIVGIKDEKNVKQSVINQSYAILQPGFDLQIHEVSIPDKKGYSVVIIRVELEGVSSFPIFHQQDKAIYVRLDEQTRKADLEQIKHLFKRENKNENHYQNYTSWINHKLPRFDEFTWCTVGVVLPQKSFSGRPFFNSDQVLMIRDALYKYRINDKLVWIHEFCPLEKPIEDPQKRLEARISTLNYKNGEPNSSIVLTRHGDQGIRICPGDMLAGSLDPKKGEHFDVKFDAQGFMLGSVGFPKETDKIDGVRLWRALHAALSFFCSDPIRACYENSNYEREGISIFFEIYGLPHVVNFDWDTARQISNPPEGIIIWGGPHERISLSSMNPKYITSICREFMGRFLASEGYISFEEELKQFDFNRV